MPVKEALKRATYWYVHAWFVAHRPSGPVDVRAGIVVPVIDGKEEAAVMKAACAILANFLEVERVTWTFADQSIRQIGGRFIELHEPEGENPIKTKEVVRA